MKPEDYNYTCFLRDERCQVLHGNGISKDGFPAIPTQGQLHVVDGRTFRAELEPPGNNNIILVHWYRLPEPETRAELCARHAALNEEANRILEKIQEYDRWWLKDEK